MTIHWPLYKDLDNPPRSAKDLQNLQANDSNREPILPTITAIQYFAEQARIKPIFEETERINQEFREAVRTFKSYPDWYTLPTYYEDCLTLLWEERCNENPILEKHCIHGETCFKLVGCKVCTPKSESDRLADEWRRKIAELHKGRNERRRQKRAATTQNAALADAPPSLETEPNKLDPKYSEEFD